MSATDSKPICTCDQSAFANCTRAQRAEAERDEAIAENERLTREVERLTEVLRKIDRLPAKWDAPLCHGDKEWAAVGSDAHLIAHRALGGSLASAQGP